jgi:hypothetical protein
VRRRRTTIPGVPSHRQRDAGLRITATGPGLFRFSGQHEVRNHRHNLQADAVRFRLEDLFARVRHCQSVWTDVVVNRRWKPKAAPFQEYSDLTDLLDGEIDRPEEGGEINEIGAALALAGNDLFRSIFFDSGRPQALREIGEMFVSLSCRGPMIITMMSDEVVVPWRLIYTHPVSGVDLERRKGRNFRWEGFWGLRHQIEHDTESDDFDFVGDGMGRPKPVIRARSGRVRLGLFSDGNIGLRWKEDRAEAPEQEYKREWVTEHRAFIKGLEREGVLVFERPNWAQAKAAFESGSFPDAIAYFLCHHVEKGREDDPRWFQGYLTTSCGHVIWNDDLVTWLNGRLFWNPVLVFINACRSAAFSPVHGAIARTFLRKGAIGVIGTEVPLPEVFADAYARRFFWRLLGPGRSEELLQVGPLVKELAWEFLKKKNPLGLAYSVYRGLDARIDW